MFSLIQEYQGPYYKKNTEDPGYLDKVGDLPSRSYYKGLSYRTSESQNDSKGLRKYRNYASGEIV
jgi:hypothetical protein